MRFAAFRYACLAVPAASQKTAFLFRQFAARRAKRLTNQRKSPYNNRRFFPHVVPLDDDPPPVVRLNDFRPPKPRLHVPAAAPANTPAAGGPTVLRFRSGGEQPGEPPAAAPQAPEDAGYVAALDELDRLHSELRQLQAAFATAFARLDAHAPDGEQQAAVRQEIADLASRLNGGFAAQDSRLSHFLDP